MTARREPSIPLHALLSMHERGLSLPQVLAVYLCEDPNGPRLTHSQAAERLGLGARQEIATHLRRARERLATH
jgi:hypothetical protein